MRLEHWVYALPLHLRPLFRGREVLYEAATLAMAEFRRCGFTADAPGPATRLTVSVKAPSTTHEIQWGKVEVWLQSAGKPNEQAMKGRLRELLRG